MWKWFSDFMGSIRYKNYIRFVRDSKGQRRDQKAPCDAGPRRFFEIEREEWYTYDKSPRPIVHVLASVDEKPTCRQPAEKWVTILLSGAMSMSRPETSTSSWASPEHFKNQAFTNTLSQFPSFGQPIHDSFSLTLLLGAAAVLFAFCVSRTAGSFRVLAFYTAKGEPDHIAFAEQATALLRGTRQEKQIFTLNRQRDGKI